MTSSFPFFCRLTFFLLSSLLAATAFAQVETDERALLNVEDGISFRRDSLFLMNLRFRMQNRAGFNTIAGDNLRIGQYEFRVRRLRLRLDGYVLSPKFQYYIQLSFSKADLDLEAGEVAQPIRDAILYYTISPKFYVGFGQSKLPGNRQRVLSSGNLQFADRSIANAAFTIDRDFGLFAYFQQEFGEKGIFYAKGAISSGDGRNASVVNEGLAFTGRLEALPFGKFKNNGDYSEGDLEREETVKLSLGATLSKNEKASRTGGQLGQELFAFRDMWVFIADGMLKYQGFALLGEYFRRTADNPFTSNDFGEIRYILTGQGLNVQASYMLTSKTELATRYALVAPSREMAGFESQLEEGLFGVTRYINKHRIKVQGNIGYRWQNNSFNTSRAGNRWTGLFQVEYGI
jgi:hypothetical protein